MFSGYSVRSMNISSPGSSKNHSALVVRKHTQAYESGNIKNTIANLSDDEILFASIDYAQKKTDKTVAGKLEKALPSLFVSVVPLVFGALSKGSLSKKAKMALSTAMVFGGTMFVCNKYDKGMDRVENASKKVENFREKHPVVAGVFDLAAKAALAFGAGYVALRGGKFLQNKFKPSADKLAKSIEKTSQRLDNSILGRGIEKINKKAENFLGKHPKISSFISKNSFLAPALTILGWFGFEAAVQHKALNNKLDYAAEMADELLCKREILKAHY